MEINDISKKLKELRAKKGYSLEEIAQMIPVSKQGYHMWEQGLRSWKLDTLTILSKILDFKITINEGILEISECIIQNNKSEVEIMFNNTELKGFKVVKLYTGADNINFEEKEILEEVMIYSSKDEAMDVFNSDSVVPVYALYDNEAGSVCYNTYGLDKTRAYSVYYWNYAPVLDDENTVYIDIEKNIKVSKGYVVIDVDNQNEDGTYPVLSVWKKKSEGALGMFVATDTDGCVIPQINYVSMDFPNILD